MAMVMEGTGVGKVSVLLEAGSGGVVMGARPDLDTTESFPHSLLGSQTPSQHWTECSEILSCRMRPGLLGIHSAFSKRMSVSPSAQAKFQGSELQSV